MEQLAVRESDGWHSSERAKISSGYSKGNAVSLHCSACKEHDETEFLYMQCNGRSVSRGGFQRMIGSTILFTG